MPHDTGRLEAQQGSHRRTRSLLSGVRHRHFRSGEACGEPLCPLTLKLKPVTVGLARSRLCLG